MKFSIVLFATAVIAAPAGPGPAVDPTKGTVDKLDNDLGGVDSQLTGVDSSLSKLDDKLGQFVEHGDITSALTNLISNQGTGLGGELNKILGNKKLAVGMGSSISASAQPDFEAATKAATNMLDEVTHTVKRQAVTDLASNSLFALLQALHLKLNTPVSSLSKRVEPAGDADLEKILESVVQAYVSGINKDISGIAGQYTGGKRSEQLSPADIASGLISNAPTQATSALKELMVIINNTVEEITKAGDLASSMGDSSAAN